MNILLLSLSFISTGLGHPMTNQDQKHNHPGNTGIVPAVGYTDKFMPTCLALSEMAGSKDFRECG